MIFKYCNKTFTGSRKQIIESLIQFLREESIKFYPGDTFELGEENVCLKRRGPYSLDGIKTILIRKASNKVPLEPFDPTIKIESCSVLHELFINDIKVDSRNSHFTIDQILKHYNININLGFDTKIEIGKLKNNSYALYFDHIPVTCQTEPFTLSTLLYNIVFFNRVRK